MVFLNAVKNSAGVLLQILIMGLMAFVPLRHVPGSRHNIILKIMPQFEKLLLLAVLRSDSVAKTDARKPEQLGPCNFHHPLVDHNRGKKKGCVLRSHAEALLDLIQSHTGKQVIKFHKH